MTTFTTAEVAEQLRVSSRKVLRLAAQNRVGADAGGRAGYRFSQADVDLMWESMRPAKPVERRRKRRAS